MDSSPTGIRITRNGITDSARIESDLGRAACPLAYRVTRQSGSDRSVIRDPFGGTIDEAPTMERALKIATSFAENVRAPAGETFAC
jgi:hypothetical protein